MSAPAVPAPAQANHVPATAEKAPSPANQFRRMAAQIAGALLRDWVGEQRAGEATGRLAAALSAAAAAAKKPEEFYACTPQSIGQCIAIAALTGIMPGNGPTALAYLIPRRPRKGEQPQLQFQFSHRGLAALAARSGLLMIPVPVSHSDQLLIVDGEVRDVQQDPDNPATEWDDLRGVMLIIKKLETGATLFRGWVAKKVIEARRDASDAYSYALKNDWAKQSDPWHQWPVEMAMKAAMHYGIARGWAIIDDTAAARALSAEQSFESHAPAPAAQVIEHKAESKAEALANRLGAAPAASAPEAGPVEELAEGELPAETEPASEPVKPDPDATTFNRGEFLDRFQLALKTAKTQAGLQATAGVMLTDFGELLDQELADECNAEFRDRYAALAKVKK